MSDLKQRYLIVPAAVLDEIAETRAVNSTVQVSAAIADNNENSQGIAIRQPYFAEQPQGFTLQTSGTPDSAIEPGVVSGSQLVQGHLAADAKIIRAGNVEDARFSWVRDTDDRETDWQWKQSPLVVHRAVHVLEHSSLDPARPWRIQPKMVVLGDGTLQCYSITSETSPVSMWDKGQAPKTAEPGTVFDSTLGRTQYYPNVVPGHWQSTSNRVVLSEMTGYPSRAWTKEALDIPVEYPVQAFTAACVPGTSDVVQISISQQSVSVYYQPAAGPRQRRARFGFLPSTPEIQTQNGFPFARTTVYSCDCVFLDSGRLCLVVADEVALRSYVSDDFGATWARSDVLSDYANDRLSVVTGDHRLIRVAARSQVDILESYSYFVKANEYCSVSLCRAANGNLILATTFPSYTNGEVYQETGGLAEDSIYRQTTSKNTLFASLAARVGIYCSVDGLVWGGGSFDMWDSPSVTTGDSDLNPSVWLSYDGYPSTDNYDHVYTGYQSVLWPYPDDVVGGFPLAYRWQVSPLPAHICVLEGADGYVDIYLTTMPAWMAPQQAYNDAQYRQLTKWQNSNELNDDLTPGWRCSQGKLLLQHRRFATKTPTPAENPDIWIPVTGNTLRRFHTLNATTLNTNTTYGGTNGLAGGIAGVAWRGSNFLLSNTYASNITAIKISDETTETRDISVGQVLYELNGWQPLQERLGWGRSVRDNTHAVQTFTLDLTGTPYDLGAAQARIYGAAWDCSALPEECGWERSAFVSGSVQGIVAATGADHGYLYTTVVPFTPPQDMFYTLEDRLPNHNGENRDSGDVQSCGLTSVTRFVVKPVAGYTVTNVSGPHAFVQVKLRGGGLGEHRAGWRLNFAISGADLDFSLVDVEAGVVVGTGSIDNGAGNWLEFVVGTQETSNKFRTTVYYRRQHNASEPDFENPYASLGRDLSLVTITSPNIAASADGVSFGLEGITTESASANYYWNYLAIHRPTSVAIVPEVITANAGYSPLTQYSDTTIANADLFSILKSPGLDDDLGNNTQASLLFNNSGVVNPLLGGQCSATPVWVSRGTYLTGAGAFTNQLDFRLETGPEYDWRNLLTHPVKREWRSPERDPSQLAGSRRTSALLRFDLPTDVLLRPSGLAFLGRNMPNVTLYFDVEVPGGSDISGLVRIRSSAIAPSGGWTPPLAPTTGCVDTISSDIWAHKYTDEGGPLALLRRNRVYFNTDGAAETTRQTYFRPNQFAQVPNGPQFYFAIQRPVETNDAGGPGLVQQQPPLVYRIKGNGADYLELEVDIEEDIYTNTAGWTINASRSLAVDQYNACVYSDRFAVDIEPLVEALQASNATDAARIQTLQLFFDGVWFRDPEHAFHRLGRMVLGELIDLSEPDCEWQWSVDTASGNRIRRTAGGPSFGYNASPAIRTFACAYPLSRPADLAESSRGVPVNQTSGTWRHKTDILNRLGMDGQECVLIWQGEQVSHGPPVALAPWPTETNVGVPTTSDPMDVMMVRAGATYNLQQQQYGCYTQPTRFSPGTKYVPLPFVAVGAITFTEEF